MPYKSKAQKNFFHSEIGRKIIPSSTIKEFDKESKGIKLPNHARETKRR